MIDQLSRELSLLIKLSVHNTAEYPGLPSGYQTFFKEPLKVF